MFKNIMICAFITLTCSGLSLTLTTSHVGFIPYIAGMWGVWALCAGVDAWLLWRGCHDGRLSFGTRSR